MSLTSLKNEFAELELSTVILLDEYLAAYELAVKYQDQSKILYDKYIQTKNLRVQALHRLQDACDHEQVEDHICTICGADI
jgi:hypothetical protein